MVKADLLIILCLGIIAQSVLARPFSGQTRALSKVSETCPKDTPKHLPFKPIVVQGDLGTRYQIVERWWRHNKDYTQGFKFLPNGRILESTGRSGKSRIQILKFDSCKHHVVRTQHTRKNDNLDFGEGTDLIKLGDGVEYVFQLTWKSRKIFVYGYPNLNRVATIPLPKQVREGWGLTHNLKTGQAYVTDGSSKVFGCRANVTTTSPKKFSFTCDQGRAVSHNGTEVTNLNELEYKDGQLFINRYMTDNIYVLDVQTWRIVKKYDMSYLKSIAVKRLASQRMKNMGYDEVLNGISWDPTRKCWMLTGKKWPVVYCVRWLS